MKSFWFTRATAVLAALIGSSAMADAQRVEMPVGYRLTWIGARWNPGAKVVDSRTGRPMAATLTYRIADPTIATVNGQGEVTARKPGQTVVWAVSGKDSASALVVVEQWAAKFNFSPATLRLDAIGVTQRLEVRASDSAGVVLVGGTNRASTCRSVNPRVATFAAGEIKSTGNGTTWIRCSDRGLADSIRVDVQQRANSAVITNKSPLRNRIAGDTFSVRVTALDRLSKPIVDARPTWVSLNPAAVSVDPVTGKARAINNGEAKILVQVGDASDSVSIAVTGSTLQPIVAPTAAVDSTPVSKKQLIVPEMFLFEAETSYVAITATDSLGETVASPSFTFRLLDTTVARKLDSARVVGRKSGQTAIIVRYGSLVDTTMVNVKPRSSIGLSGGTAGATGAGRSNFIAPTIPDSGSQYSQRRDSVVREIHLDPNTAAARQNFVFTPTAFGAIAEHLVRTEAGILEDRTGPIYGGGGSLLLLQKLELNGVLRLGTLSSTETIGEDLNVTEFEGSLGYFPVRQVGLRTGIMMRGERSKLATQTWFVPKVSLVTRFSFIGDIVNTYAAISMLPKAKFSGLEDETGSLFSRGGEAGLEVKRGVVNAGLTYFVEQLSFDESPRFESFSAIRLKLGFNLGR